MRTHLLLVSLLALPVLATPKVSVLPAHPLIENTGRGTQSLNFDLLLENGEEKLEITGIEMTLYAPDGTFLGQQRLQSNGMSILTLPGRELAPGARVVLFNPFHTLPDDLRLGRLHYEIELGEAKQVHVDVEPRAFAQKTVLELPVRGRVFVHDGHDFLAHHRRLDITGPMTTKLGIRTNMTRYAYDFVTVDGQGAMRKNKANDNGDWYCFGEPVFAPGDGVVLKAVGDEPDNDDEHPWRPDFEKVLEDIHRIGGNRVLIDHGNGEYSWLAHLKQGSVTVKPGDRVRRGDRIGAIGRSGDAMFPHLHYQLQSDAYLGEGLPSSFTNFQRVTGGAPRAVKRGAVDTGDVLIVKGPRQDTRVSAFRSAAAEPPLW